MNKPTKVNEYLIAAKADFHLRESAPALLVALKSVTNGYEELWRSVAGVIPNEKIIAARQVIADAENPNK